MRISWYESERRPVGLRNAKRSDTRRSIGRQKDETKQDQEEAAWSDLEIDLGYCYESTAIIPEPQAEESPPPAHSRLSCRAGKRAPHVWLVREGKCISTVDLYDQTLTLVTGSSGAAWCEAADSIARSDEVPLVAHLIGPEGELQSADRHWSEAYGIDADGALLIRPDGFVAWRRPGAVDDHQTVLREVVEQIVGRSPSYLQQAQASTGQNLENAQHTSKAARAFEP